MEPVSFGLAILGSLDILRKTSDTVTRAVRAYANAKEAIPARLKDVELEILKLTKDMEILDQLILENVEDDTKLLGLQLEALEKLRSNADDLRSQLGSLDEDVKSIRARQEYATKLSRLCDNFMVALKEWYQMYGISFYTLSRIVSASRGGILDSYSGRGSLSRVVRHLREARLETSTAIEITQWKDHLNAIANPQEMLRIPFSLAHLAQDANGIPIILQIITSRNRRDIGEFERDIADLGAMLARLDSAETNLLDCKDVVRMPLYSDDSPSFYLCLSFPAGFNEPKSLRHYLHDSGQSTWSLNDKLDLAKALAKSVICLHAAKFVHKSIWPENLLIFEAPDHRRQAFLIGFELFRPADQTSLKAGTKCWNEGLYRHPQRQGLFPQEDYKMQHDIYSLGVCLLEIGLWESFVLYKQEKNVGSGQPECDSIQPSSLLKVDPRTPVKIAPRAHAKKVKSMLENIAKQMLPQKMGLLYTETTISCLTCLENTAFGADLNDRTGITIGNRTIQLVYQRLQSINL